MVNHFEKKGYITRTFLICPTRGSNDVFNNLSTLQDLDVCDNEKNGNVALEQVLMRIQDDWHRYTNLLKYNKLYKKYLNNKDLLSFKEERLLEEYGYVKPPVPVRPSHMLIIDDMAGSDIYSNNRKNDILNHNCNQVK